MYSYVSLCGYVPMSTGACVGQRHCIPWRWSYRSWAAQHGCWEPNSGHLQELGSLLNAELSFLPQDVFLTVLEAEKLKDVRPASGEGILAVASCCRRWEGQRSHSREVGRQPLSLGTHSLSPLLRWWYWPMSLHGSTTSWDFHLTSVTLGIRFLVQESWDAFKP